MKTLTRYEALAKAIAFYPSQQAFADSLGVSQPTVWRWLNQSKQLPAEYVLKVEAATGVSRHLLRPDIYPRDMAPVPVAVIAEQTPLCGPILSTRSNARKDNRRDILDSKGEAA